MASTANAPIDHESRSSRSRMTREGRRITYQLSVIQQPERARACGQGAKSTTDRRPVDPPPIVSLHIYDGPEGNLNEITFSHRANFFLLTTIEEAPRDSRDRSRSVQQSATAVTAAAAAASTTASILTGSPVSGMCYLDRPNPAGYFIFPDLSVRHEGRYILAFTLYEELKELKDEDALDTAPASTATASGTGAHVHARCEIKSAPFTVFSAKKFPGLTESTVLSRMVADQGCRVRIRRDVRMRRRGDKGEENWADYEDETAEAREKVADAAPPAPDPVSVEAKGEAETVQSTTFTQPTPRHSNQDLNATYQQPQSQPQPQPQPQHTQQAQLNTQQDTHHISYGQHPPLPPPPPTTYHPHPFDPSQMAHFAPQHYVSPHHFSPYYPSPYGHPAAAAMIPYGHAPYGYMPHQPMTPSGAYDQLGHEFMPPTPYPRAAMYTPSQMQSPASVAAPEGTHHRITLSSNSEPKDLPPLKPAQTQHTPEHSLSYPRYGNGIADVPAPPPPPVQYTSTQSQGRAPKRGYDDAFDGREMNGRLQNGARPNGNAQEYNYDQPLPVNEEISDSDQSELEQLRMTYRRADGTEITRRWPALAQ